MRIKSNFAIYLSFITDNEMIELTETSFRVATKRQRKEWRYSFKRVFDAIWFYVSLKKVKEGWKNLVNLLPILLFNSSKFGLSQLKKTFDEGFYTLLSYQENTDYLEYLFILKQIVPTSLKHTVGRRGW